MNLLSCFSINNLECRLRPQIVNINSNESTFFPISLKKSKCNGSCNNINNPHAKLCVPDIVKNLNVKVFNLVSRTNETKYIEWYQTCKCKCRLDGRVCNSEQRWNDCKCRCECKELIDKCVCDKGSIWNPSNCECECDKLCDVRKYLDYENCKCRKKLVDKLVDECTENVEEVKLAKITSTENENVCKCSSYTVYIGLISVLFTFNVGIATYFVYLHWFSLFALVLKKRCHWF